jgi:mono/diheme cytochrome c family protein
MSASRFLDTAALSLTLVTIACRGTHERERMDFERMRVQQRYGLYGSSRVFSNHQMMQAPPQGTVTREATLDSARTTPQLLERGGQKFAIYCAVCHGAAAFGGSLVAEDMGAPRPPSLRTSAMVALAPTVLFDVVTKGFGRMPAYAPQLTTEERWAVVAYVKLLQHTPATSPDAIADSLRAAEIRGIDSALASGRRP